LSYKLLIVVISSTDGIHHWIIEKYGLKLSKKEEETYTTRFSGQPGYAGTTNVKPIPILMKQEIMGWQ